MPNYRMLLIEELVISDSGEFTVDAESPAHAAALLIQAHDAARDEDSDIVRLPDGQERRIEPDDVVRSRVFCVLLNESGEEVGEVEPDSSGATEDATIEDHGGNPS